VAEINVKKGALMKLESHQKETVILDPAKGMALRTIPIEIRTDPLTGRTARICHFMDLKWERPDFQKLVAGTEASCPFCPDRVLKVTPSFPEEILSGGRIIREDMVLFPNIAPYDSLGAVATLGDRHYIPMTEIEPERIANGFRLAMEFFRIIHESAHPESVYHIINWNYMPPSGSSIIHPHLQVFSTSSAPNLMRQELEGARIYMEKNGTNYWDDLVASETANGARFLGKTGRVTWLTAYAPMGVAGDVLAVAEGVRCTLELTDDDLSDLAYGLTRVMAGYDKMGIYSFNMNFFSGAEGDDHVRFHLLFSPRSFFNQKLGTPDAGALRNLFNETVCMAFPEEIKERLLPAF
jgi:UDPglucose--hexose-1-phosphate uridylyltransferase